MRKKTLVVFEKNARIDIHKLAILLGENEAAVVDEVADMGKENVIRGYHTLINWESTSNEHMETLIEVNMTPQRGIGCDRITGRIYQYDEADSVYPMSGAFDFIVLLEGGTMREVALFVLEWLASLESVAGTLTCFAPRKYKDHGTGMKVKKEDERQLFMT